MKPFCPPSAKDAPRRLEERFKNNVVAQPFCTKMAKQWTIFFHRGLLPNGSPNRKFACESWPPRLEQKIANSALRRNSLANANALANEIAKSPSSLRQFLANGSLRQNSIAIANAMAWCTQIATSIAFLCWGGVGLATSTWSPPGNSPSAVTFELCVRLNVLYF